LEHLWNKTAVDGRGRLVNRRVRCRWLLWMITTGWGPLVKSWFRWWPGLFALPRRRSPVRSRCFAPNRPDSAHLVDPGFFMAVAFHGDAARSQRLRGVVDLRGEPAHWRIVPMPFPGSLEQGCRDRSPSVAQVVLLGRPDRAVGSCRRVQHRLQRGHEARHRATTAWWSRIRSRV